MSDIQNQKRELKRLVEDYKRASSDDERMRIKDRMRERRDMIRRIEEGIDLQTGIAPMQRARLAAARTPEEQQAYLETQFPGVRQSGSSGWDVQAEPGGRWIAANPPGIEFGDVAALADPAIRTVLGTIGGAAGMLGGVPGAIGGGAAGEALGGQVSNYLLRPEYNPTLQERAMDVGIDATIGALGETAGAVGRWGMNRAMRPVIGTAEQAANVVSPFIRQGIPPANRAVLQPTPVNVGAVGATEASPFLGGHFIKSAQQQADEAFESRIAALTELRGRAEAGDAALDAMRGYSAARRAAEGSPFERFSNAMQGQNIPLSRTMAIVRQNADLQESNILGDLAYRNPIISRLMRRSEKFGDTADWDTLLAARGEVRSMLKKPAMAGSNQAERRLRQLRDAMTEDLESAIGRTEYADAFGTARRAYAQMKDELGKLDKTFREDIEPEIAIDKIITLAKTKPTQLAEVRKAIESGDPGAWASVQQALLHDFALATPGVRQAGVQGGGDLTSTKSLLTKLNRLGQGTDRQQAMTALFGAPGTAMRDNVDDLVAIASREEAAKEMINRSRTGNVIGLSAAGTGLAGLAHGITAGEPMTAIGGVLMPILSNMTAVWLTRPGFVRKAARLAENPTVSPMDLERMIYRSLGHAGAQNVEEYRYENP